MSATARPPTSRRRVRIEPLSPRRRAAAWFVTGPLGHLYAGVVDWAAWFAHWVWARARAQLSRS